MLSTCVWLSPTKKQFTVKVTVRDDDGNPVAGSFKVKTFEEFQALCPAGSEPNASYRMVTTYWEMVASFLTSGVLNNELFYQSGRELLFVWERVRDIVPAAREAFKHPRELRNLEEAATAYIGWWNHTSPGAYDAFSKRVRG